MSSKFFTWSKGDRKVAHEVLGVRGLDCINPEGSRKDGKKPSISIFDSPSSPNSKHSSRTTDSFALQDAAVQSATNLIAVMNDVLRSPHLSAHINAQLSASHGRQRSHTAPPTPRYEVSGSVPPAELPGSFPETVPVPSSDQLHHLNTPEAHTVGQDIQRPHSNPEEDSRQSQCARRVSAGCAAESHALRSPVKGEKRSRQMQPRYSSDSYEVVEQGKTLATQKKARSIRPFVIVADAQSSRTPRPRHLAPSLAVPSRTPAELAGTPLIQSHQADSEAALIRQIAYMRTSHESHILSLKDVHSKEIETHRTYISFLENRRRVSATPMPDDFKGRLSIDTSGCSSSRSSDCSTLAGASASSATAADSYGVGSQETIAEVEALKLNLSVLRQKQIDATELTRERDELKLYAERSDRRILQLKDIIRKTKDSQRALVNANANLEARLQACNVQRVDLMEGLSVASSDVCKLSKAEQLLVNELDQLRRKKTNRLPRHLSDSVLSQAAIATNSAESDKESENSTSITRSPNEAEQLRGLLDKQSARIRELEALREATCDTNAALAECKIQLANAQADCERYNSHLHSEFRRQSRKGARRSLVEAPGVEAEASAVAAEKIKSAIPSGSEGASDKFKEAIQLLEKELEYCTREIIMYKLDAKGYKKDLKNAKLEIDCLHALDVFQKPPTPERTSGDEVRTHSRCPLDLSTLDRSRGGLGIQLPDPTPPSGGSVKKATSISARRSTPTDLVSPKSTTSDVLGKGKALPDLPPASLQPDVSSAVSPGSSPNFRMQRGETFRSLSDSIISSYARRSTPQQHQVWNSPPLSDWVRRDGLSAGSVQNSPVPPRRRRSDLVAH